MGKSANQLKLRNSIILHKYYIQIGMKFHPLVNQFLGFDFFNQAKLNFCRRELFPLNIYQTQPMTKKENKN